MITLEKLKSLNPCEIVANDLKRKGFTVSYKKENENGIDLTAIKNGTTFTFEVKLASKSTRSFRVGSLCKSGKNSEYIAIVLPSGEIFYEDMESHIKCCSANLSRHITGIVNLFDAFGRCKKQ